MIAFRRPQQLVLTTLATLLAVVAIVVMAGPATAHTGTATVVPINSIAASTTVTSANSSTTTAVGEARMATQTNAITDEGSAQSEAGRYVFLGVCAVIVVGASVLFLKYRKKSAIN